jgi:hypothetical protein
VGRGVYAYVGGNPETYRDPLGLFLTSVDAACAIDPEFCAEIMGNMLQSHGAIVARETGNQCIEEEADRVANGFRTAGAIASIATVAMAVPGFWGNLETLGDHFERHGSDFGATSLEDYAQQASDFLTRSQVEGLPTKIDSNGTIRVYDPATNTFGAYNPNGSTLTFFKPSSPTYFSRQPGNSPWTP